MTDGADNPHCSQEPGPVDLQSGGTGSGVFVRPKGNSSGGSSAGSQAEPSLGPAPVSADEWTHYIDRQIREDWPDLDDQRRAFAEVYIQCLNYREAATEAGFSANRGRKLWMEPLVKSYLLWRRRQVDELMGVQNFITKTEILARNEMIYEVAMAEEPTLCVTSQGDAFEARKHDLGQARACLELAAKIEGHMKPEEQKSAPVNVVIDMGALTGSPVSENNVVIEIGDDDAS